MGEDKVGYQSQSGTQATSAVCVQSICSSVLVLQKEGEHLGLEMAFWNRNEGKTGEHDTGSGCLLRTWTWAFRSYFRACL